MLEKAKHLIKSFKTMSCSVRASEVNKAAEHFMPAHSPKPHQNSLHISSSFRNCLQQRNLKGKNEAVKSS